MKKVPLRKCVATGEQLPKKELIRIVKIKKEKFLSILQVKRTVVELI